MSMHARHRRKGHRAQQGAAAECGHPDETLPKGTQTGQDMSSLIGFLPYCKLSYIQYGSWSFLEHITAVCRIQYGAQP